MKVKLLSSLGLMGLMLTGCFTVTSGNIINNGKDSDATVKKEINLSSFDEIQVSQGIKVVVNQGQYTGKVSVATTPSAENYLKVTVSDGTLKAYYDNKSMKGKIKGPSIIYVTIPEIEEADLSSGAYMHLKGMFNSNGNVEFDLSSGAAINVDNLTCSKLSIDTSSGSSATIESLRGNLDAESSSGSSLSVVAVDGDNLKFAASSGASISANSVKSGSIKARASSGGSISLSGKADSLDKSTSSGGSVNTSGLKLK